MQFHIVLTNNLLQLCETFESAAIIKSTKTKHQLAIIFTWISKKIQVMQHFDPYRER